MIFPLVLGDASREPIDAGYRQVGLELIDTKILDHVHRIPAPATHD
jgi:hypothetical protein